MTETTTNELRGDEMVVALPWQEVIRLAHRRALEVQREKKAIEAAGTDTTVPA
ncbi:MULTISPECIES: hypothetical protein [Haloferax]|uniref:Uncharacterized protein n=1 Tax=Haloferax marinum TaxID=2666143 RepID=A0A6A8G9C1_9EURY|nr:MULTISPECIES: hypothetical protein [Haloferax]MRW97779.1 hypothetical protein [Haloferax marinum]